MSKSNFRNHRVREDDRRLAKKERDQRRKQARARKKSPAQHVAWALGLEKRDG